MEDISRELEREIARSRPRPFKKDLKTRTLTVDDFGRIRAADHLRPLVRGLAVISALAILALVALYDRYADLSGEAVQMAGELDQTGRKIAELKAEKEILMARLVIAGEDPVISKPSTDSAKIPLAGSRKPAENLSPETVDPATGDEPGGSAMAAETPDENEPETQKIISLENFSVSRDRAHQDLMVRFDIRNISKETGGVSGRIFTVLKPDTDDPETWRVVPPVSLKNGIPQQPRKGQYFSIAHFKPVQFRIKNASDPEFFQKAAIYIFNDQGDLIFERLIDITEGG